MSNPTIREERKLLTQLLRRHERPMPRLLAVTAPTIIVWMGTALFVMLLFRVAKGDRVDPVALAIGSAIVGFLLASLFFWIWSMRQWPFIRPHVDTSSIKARLSELDKVRTAAE